MNEKKSKDNKINELDKLRIKQFVLKYLSSTSTLSITALFTPNFNISSFPILLLSSLVIVVLDYLLSLITGVNDTIYCRGIVSFISSAIIIYVTQFIVIGYYISIPSSIIAALIYATVSSFIPNECEGFSFTEETIY